MTTTLVASVCTLIERLVPALQLDDDADPRGQRLLQLCLRILGSRMGSSPLSGAATGEGTRRRLLQAGCAADALTYSESVQRLERFDHGLRNLPAALQLLGSLLHSRSAPIAVISARGAMLRPSGTAAPPSTAARGSVCAPEPNPPAPGGGPSRKLPRWEVTTSDGGELSEATLVRELLFVMQNIDGAHLRWDETRDAFVLPRGAAVPPGARQLAGQLSELGWLFRQVQSFVKAAGAAAAAASATAASGCASEGGAWAAAAAAGAAAASAGVAPAGLVPQALRHALQIELDEWYQLLAVLEEQRQSELTLLQLSVWSAQPMQRLLLMAQLARACAPLKGGAMIVAIARHERHGDPLVRGYVRHLLRAAAAPLFGMIRMWVLQGELRDAHEEFFIESRATPLTALWEQRYALIASLIASRIASLSASLIASLHAPRSTSLMVHLIRYAMSP
jgi:gamma-tubulin complex component 3